METNIAIYPNIIG